MMIELLNHSLLASTSSDNPLVELLKHHLLDHNIFKFDKIFGIIDISLSKHVIIMWTVSIILIVLVLGVAKAIKKDKSATGGRLTTLVEIFVEFIHNDVVKPNFHNDSKKWLPFFLTLFFFIMFCNLFGLFPESSTVTGNIAVTMILAIITFILTQIYGMYKKGVIGYLAHLVPSGVPKALYPLLLLIELIGLFTKPFALTIRLFANMLAGHIVMLVLLYLTTFAQNYIIRLAVAPLTISIVIFVNILEIFICILQAYIFTFLSAIFISEAGSGH